jgi:two-component system sensor histidine kinase KdpD
VVAAQQSAPGLKALELHLDNGRIISPEQEPALQLLAAQLRNVNCTSLPSDNGQLVLCERFSDGLVVAVVSHEHATDAAAHLSIIALAAERWALTHRLVQADVFRQSEQFKTALLSSVSHDFRTPLSVISASAGSLLRYRDTLSAEAQQDLLKSIEQQSRRLDQLTGNLLSLGRIEGGFDKAAMPTIDALDVLGEVLVAVREKAPARSITKAYGLKEAPVRAEPSLLHQIMANVLENAVVHTPEDADIHVSVEASGRTLLMRVDDEGPGVEETEREEIFERFRQGAAAQARRHGAGLGLSIARGFARALHGDVVVLPRKDGLPGARFEVRLPLEEKAR